MAENINISIGNVVRQGGIARIRMRRPSSTVNKVSVNEWPVLLNALLTTDWVGVTKNTGFTYTFPFALAKGTGFPYCLPMELDGEPAIMRLG